MRAAGYRQRTGRNVLAHHRAGPGVGPIADCDRAIRLNPRLASAFNNRGAARYDLNANKFDQTRLGIGYVDDCLILALNYITNYSYGTGTPSLDHTIMLQLTLRTLGGTSVSQSVTGVGGL